MLNLCWIVCDYQLHLNSQILTLVYNLVKTDIEFQNQGVSFKLPIGTIMKNTSNLWVYILIFIHVLLEKNLKMKCLYTIIYSVDRISEFQKIALELWELF